MQVWRLPALRLSLLAAMLVTLPGTGLARCACRNGATMVMRACSHRTSPTPTRGTAQLTCGSCCSLQVAEAAAAAAPSISQLDRLDARPAFTAVPVSLAPPTVHW